MAAQASTLNAPQLGQLTSIANDWHKCERFEQRGNRCPYQTAGIEQDDQPDDDPDTRFPRIIPARKRINEQQVNLQIPEGATTFDVQTTPSPLPQPIPFPTPGSRPQEAPGPALPAPEPIPDALPEAAITRLPDGLPSIPTTNAPPNLDLAGLINWLSTSWARALATKPAFSLPALAPLTQPSTTLQPTRQLSITLENLRNQAAIAEEDFARDFGSTMQPVSTIAQKANTPSTKTPVSKAQIAMAGAAAAAAGTAGYAAQSAARRGGFGGLHFPSRLDIATRTAR